MTNLQAEENCGELEANIRESRRRAETLLQVALKEALEPQRRDELDN